MAGLNKVTVDDIQAKGKKILVRCDFNVPLKDGEITNDNRITAALPTIKKLLADGGKLVLCSHLGKPKNGPEAKFSLAPVAKRLQELLPETKVVFAADDTVVGENAKAAVAAMNDGEIVLLENTRFRGAEETKEAQYDGFSKELADLVDGQAFVMDAFGSSHRAHASTVGAARFVKETAVGYLMQKEIQYLGNAVEDPQHPFVAILGGAKVADKLNVISNLLEKCDTLIIGGGMAYTFVKAQGGAIGKSLVDDEKLDYCKEMLAKAEKLGKKILLPVDTAIAAEFPDPIDAEISVDFVDTCKIPDDMMGLDIGPKTAELFAAEAKAAKTVVWNGPMGVFENPTLKKGTVAVCEALAAADATTIIGGGDSATAAIQLGYADKMSHISTGGGASLEYLEGKVLPGVAAIAEK
ncbi:MAG: phosphoglycerate kinase [Oscillospiraceae bacterium]|nr:phosphoglycerate kinase [Oscillospiraceae bacterium]